MWDWFKKNFSDGLFDWLNAAWDWAKKEWGWLIGFATWIFTPLQWVLDYIIKWMDKILLQLQELQKYVEQTNAFDAPQYLEQLTYYAGLAENLFPLKFALTTISALMILAVVCVVLRYFKKMIPFFGK